MEFRFNTLSVSFLQENRLNQYDYSQSLAKSPDPSVADSPNRRKNLTIDQKGRGFPRPLLIRVVQNLTPSLQKTRCKWGEGELLK
jgi:hypothetical protein